MFKGHGKIHYLEKEIVNDFMMSLDLADGKFTVLVSQQVDPNHYVSYVEMYICEDAARRAFNKYYFLIEQDMWHFPLTG